MKRTVIAGLLVTMMNGQAMAVMDGNELLEYCEKDTAFASAYLIGIAEGHFFSHWKMPGPKLICFPKGSLSKQTMILFANISKRIRRIGIYRQDIYLYAL